MKQGTQGAVPKFLNKLSLLRSYKLFGSLKFSRNINENLCKKKIIKSYLIVLFKI